MEQGFNNGPKNKVDEYIERYKSGESIESFGDIPESWKSKILASEDSKLESNQELKEAKGLENIKNVLEEAARDNYVFTHITAPDVAEDIYNSNFKYSLGTGLSGTMALTGGSGAVDQISKILDGQSPHRNLKGMFIITIPKNLLPEHGPDFKVNSDKIEEFLIDNYDSMASGEILKEFNFGYLQGDTFYHK